MVALRRSVERAAHGEAAAVEDVSVDHGRPYVGMAEKFLNSSDVVTGL